MSFSPSFVSWKGTWSIELGEDIYKTFPRISGSYGVIYSRILGLSYAEGWRFLRNTFGADIYRKEGTYCAMSFDSELECRKCCVLLNARWEVIKKRIKNRI